MAVNLSRRYFGYIYIYIYTFLAPFADKQTRNYDTECSNHHPSQSTLRSKGLNVENSGWKKRAVVAKVFRLLALAILSFYICAFSRETKNMIINKQIRFYK